MPESIANLQRRICIDDVVLQLMLNLKTEMSYETEEGI